MLLMHNDSFVSIGQFNVKLVVFSFCKEINLLQPISLTLPKRDVIKKCAHVIIT
jgi:hypothetical protein